MIEFVFSSCLKCSDCFLQVLKFLPPHPTLNFLFLSSFCTPTSLAVMLADLKYWVWSFSLVTNPVCLFVCSLCVCFPHYFVFFFFAFIQLKYTVTLSKHSGGSLWLQMTQNLGSHYLFITQSSHIWEEDICTMVKRNVHNRNQPFMAKSNSNL